MPTPTQTQLANRTAAGAYGTTTGGTQSTTSLSQGGNGIVGGNYTAVPDAAPATSTSTITPPQSPSSESDVYSSYVTQGQNIIDQINNSTQAQIAAANANIDKTAATDQQNQNAVAAMTGGFGSTAVAGAGKVASDASNQKNTQDAALQAQATQQITGYLQQLQTAAQSQANYEQTTAFNQGITYTQFLQQQAAPLLSSFSMQGVTPDQLSQNTNPLAQQTYQNLLKAYGGDPNALNAAYAMSSQKSLMNNGQPIAQSGSTLIYGQQVTNADGTPGVKTFKVDVPNLPTNYKIQSYNQAANGQIGYMATPVDANGNAILDPSQPNNGIISGFFGGTGAATGAAGSTSPDPTSTAITGQTGLSIQAFNFLTQGTTALSRMPNNQRQQVMDEAQKWANDNGIDLATFQSQYKAYNDTLSQNISRFNNTQIAENELQGTANNMQTVLSDTSLNTLKPENVAKLLAGQQVNDPNAMKYSSYLNQLKTELAYYYAATEGKSSPEQSEEDSAASVIVNGISAGSVSAFQDYIKQTTQKMGSVLQKSVDSSRQNVWSLFGVGQNYQPGGSSGTDTTSTSDTSGGSGGTVDTGYATSW